MGRPSFFRLRRDRSDLSTRRTKRSPPQPSPQGGGSSPASLAPPCLLFVNYHGCGVLNLRPPPCGRESTRMLSKPPFSFRKLPWLRRTQPAPSPLVRGSPLASLASPRLLFVNYHGCGLLNLRHPPCGREFTCILGNPCLLFVNYHGCGALNLRHPPCGRESTRILGNPCFLFVNSHGCGLLNLHPPHKGEGVHLHPWQPPVFYS